MVQRSITLTVDPVLQGAALSNRTRRLLRGVWDKNLGEAVDAVKRNTAIFEGDLRAGYAVEPSLFRGDEISGAIINPAPNSLFRERGRAPGRQPPSFPGSPLARWARAKGLNPYLVARKIAERGTARWRENRNALGIDRSSVPGNYAFQLSGPIIDAKNGIIKDGNAIKI